MTAIYRLAAICGAALVLSPLPAMAQPTVALDSAVFVEKTKPSGNREVRTLEPVSRLSRGDRVVTLVTWYRLGGNGAFTVTNAMPQSLAYQGSAEGTEEVSVDGGKSWGHLGDMRFGSRMATTEDVTHVRWHVSQIAAQTGTGRIAYAGLVR